jgi:hypothetical protein
VGKVLKAAAIGAVVGAVAIGTGGFGAGVFSGFSLTTGSAFVGVTGIGITAATAGGIAGGLLGAALSVAGGILAPGLPSVKQPGAGVAANSIQPIANAPLVYGRARVGGPFAFYHARQVTEGDTPVDYRYFVVTLAAHEIDAIEEIWLNDSAVTLDGSQMVTTGDYASNCWIWPQTGTESDAPPSVFTSETNSRWTSSHQGKGIAKLYVKFKLTEDIIKQGIPRMTAVIRGKKVYDPDTDTTAYSNNAILCAYDYHITPRVDGGFGLDEEAVDWDFVSEQAAVCDESVTTLAGSENRYCIDGVIDTGAGADTIRAAMLLAMAADYTFVGGELKIYPGKFRTVTGTVAEGDFIGPVKYDPLADDSNRMDGVRGVFISEDNKWQPVEFPVVGDAETNDRVMDLEFPFTKSGAAVQRISKIILLKTQAQRALSMPLSLTGLKWEALDNITVRHPRHAHISNLTWQVTNWAIGSDFSVQVQAREENPEMYEWDVSEEQEVKAAALDLQEPDIGAIGAPGAPTLLTANAVSASQIDIQFTMPASFSTGWLLYRNTTSDLAAAAFIASGSASPSQVVNYSNTGLTTATTYYYWVRAMNFTGFTGNYSAATGPASDTTL